MGNESRAPESSELDEYDLLNGESTISEASDDLGLSALSARMQKKFEAHKEAESQAAKEAKERHTLLLTALMRARKILRGVASLDLGADIELRLLCDDLQGWPRIGIKPKKKSQPLRELSIFEIVGNDRSGAAQLEMKTDSGSIREELMLFRTEDLDKLPRLMKRIIRTFLDGLAEEVMRPMKEIEEKIATPEEISPQSEALKSADLFEEAVDADGLDRLPEIDNLGALDGFDKK